MKMMGGGGGGGQGGWAAKGKEKLSITCDSSECSATQGSSSCLSSCE